MERINLVRNLSDVDITNSSNPTVRPESVVGELRVSEELAAQISGRARAGLAITLEFLAQERENGFFLIAGSLGSIPVAVNTVEKPESMVTINGGQTEPEAVPLPDATILDPNLKIGFEEGPKVTAESRQEAMNQLNAAPPQGDKTAEKPPVK